MYAQFRQGAAEVGGFHRGLDVLGLAGKLEHAVAVAVEGDGQAPALNQALHQDEVASGVLHGTDTALTTMPMASSTASSRVKYGPCSPSQG